MLTFRFSIRRVSMKQGLMKMNLSQKLMMVCYLEHQFPLCSDEGLTFETSTFLNSLRRLIYPYQLHVDNELFHADAAQQFL